MVGRHTIVCWYLNRKTNKDLTVAICVCEYSKINNPFPQSDAKNKARKKKRTKTIKIRFNTYVNAQKINALANNSLVYIRQHSTAQRAMLAISNLENYTLAPMDVTVLGEWLRAFRTRQDQEDL